MVRECLLSRTKLTAVLALCGKTLVIWLTASQGKGTSISDCDHCDIEEKNSLGHILKMCGGHMILAETAQAASKLGYTTLLEPHINTSKGLQKPDLVVYIAERNIAAVMDVTIYSENTEVNRAHINKVETYKRHPKIIEYVEALS